MVQMETKMLMPSVPAAMAKLHQRNDAFVKFRNVNSVKKPPIDILEYFVHINPKIKEREDMLKAVQLIDFVPQFTQRFQRVTYPFAKKDPWNNVTTIANEERKVKIQFQRPVQEPQVVQEPKPKLKPEPEPELKPELKSNSESEAEPKLKSEIETETKSEPHLYMKYYSEQELEDLGVQEWQQLLRQEPNPEWEEELRKLLRQWATYPDYETRTTRECLNRLLWSETEEDSIIQLKMYDPVTKSKVKEVKRLTTDSTYRYFITCENANRMLSETVIYENVSPGNQNKNVQQCQPKTQIANRSLLRCQQNVNNTNSGAMNIPHQPPSTSGQLSSTSGQVSSDRILRSSGQPVLTSDLNCQENVVTSNDQQVNCQEENQDEVEMMKELNSHKQATQNGDTNEEPTFQHQMNVSEYINRGLTGSSPSLNNEEQSSTTTSQSQTTTSQSQTTTSQSQTTTSQSQTTISQSQQAIASRKRCRRKTEEKQRQNDIKNTLIDHCYHLNEPEGAQRLKMKESDEEEIDVESFEYQATCCNYARTQYGKAAVAKANDTSTCRRPRGRPPGRNYGKRKKDAEDDQVDKPALKRSRVKSNRRTVRHQNNIQPNQNESEETKRHNHNCLERQRRAHLKKIYDDLRKNIPAVASNPKAAKVDILKYGRAHAIELFKIEAELSEVVDKEKDKLKRLKHKCMALAKMKIELEQRKKIKFPATRYSKYIK